MGIIESGKMGRGNVGEYGKNMFIIYMFEIKNLNLKEKAET